MSDNNNPVENLYVFEIKYTNNYRYINIKKQEEKYFRELHNSYIRILGMIKIEKINGKNDIKLYLIEFDDEITKLLENLGYGVSKIDLLNKWYIYLRSSKFESSYYRISW